MVKPRLRVISGGGRTPAPSWRHRRIRVADQDGERTINIKSDEPFIRSLAQLGFVSLEPSQISGRRAAWPGSSPSAPGQETT